jgi:hypothetical protein
MEIKLKTIVSAESKEMIIDEFGVSWNYLAPEAAYDILPATTKGLDGDTIQGFYQNGALFIVNLSDARKYFGSLYSENRDWKGVRPVD